MTKKKATLKKPLVSTEVVEEKKPGRPSKYDPAYCKMLIDHMSEGLSFNTFAAVIDVNVDTLYEWAKTDKHGKPIVHADFSDAKKLAFNKNLLWWEKVGIEGLWNKSETEARGNSRSTTSKSFNSANWIFQMKNRHKWRDKTEDERNEEKANTIRLLSYVRNKKDGNK